MKTLTPQEVARLLSIAKDTAYYSIIYTAVNTGLRQAELLGLRWRRLDLSVSAQLKALREYALRNGCTVVKEYVDEAESSPRE
jgi:integrase